MCDGERQALLQVERGSQSRVSHHPGAFPALLLFTVSEDVGDAKGRGRE